MQGRREDIPKAIVYFTMEPTHIIPFSPKDPEVYHRAFCFIHTPSHLFRVERCRP
jgi:hypothetical protein